MKHLLIPVNFTTSGLSAAEYGVAMARDLEASVTFIYVVEQPLIHSLASMEVLREEAEKRMFRFFTRINSSNTDLVMNYKVTEGNVTETICDFASAHAIDMIIAGINTSRLQRRFSVSIMHHLARHSPCPVIEVPKNTSYKPIRKIIYTTDGSRENLDHIKLIIPFAVKNKASVTLLFINKVAEENNYLPVHKIAERLKQETEYALINGIIADDITVGEGVSDYARTGTFDCVVVYSGHHDSLAELYHKSSLKEITNLSSVPVLVLHKNDDAFLQNDRNKEDYRIRH